MHLLNRDVGKGGLSLARSQKHFIHRKNSGGQLFLCVMGVGHYIENFRGNEFGHLYIKAYVMRPGPLHENILSDIISM